MALQTVVLAVMVLAARAQWRKNEPWIVATIAAQFADHPAKDDPVAGAAVSVTVDRNAKLPVQDACAPQLNPDSELVTEPAPCPTL